MDIQDILHELSFDTGDLPREALESAISKRHEITPYLLKILEDAIDRVDEIIEQDWYSGHLYAMYLLAQFRETKAFPLIIKLLSFPGEIPHSIAGDVLTEDLSRILASVYSDDLLPLKKMIENPSLNEYVRAAGINAYVQLVGSKMLTRNQAIAYLKSLFSTLEEVPSYVWDSLVISACDLYPDEFTTEIKEAFSKKLIDTNVIDESSIENILSRSKEEHLSLLYLETELIEDAVTEMEKWISCPC